jgi:hypothetical protein
MLKKKIRRPLRIFTKTDIPYIIYKSKKYNIKSTEIKDILKFINKLHKKTTKLIQTDNKPKKDIKTYLNEKIKLIGGPINIPSTQNIQNIEKETFLKNELNDTINKSKLEQSLLEKQINELNKTNSNLEKSIIEKENNISLLKVKKKKYKNDQSNISKKSSIKSNDLSMIKQGNFEDELNNEINLLDDLKKDQKKIKDILDELSVEKNNLENDIINLKSKLKQSQLGSELKDTIFNKKFNKLQQDIKNIEEEKQNFESLTKLQQQSLLNKENKIKEKELELLKKQKELDRKQKYSYYDKNYSNELLDVRASDLFGFDRNSVAKFIPLYHEFYGLENDPKYKKNQKVSKEDYINFILDKEEQLKEQQQPEQIQIQEQGNGKNVNDFGLWNYQIDKIMAPFKLYIKAITLDELDDMIKYIYDNKILIGSFILNIGNHWTAIYFDFEKEFVLEYYDPFGEPPKNIIIKSFKDLILKFNIEVFVKFKINKIQQQDIKTSNCGWFTMYFLIMRYNNYTFKYITKFKDTNKDEQNIEQLKDKYDNFGFL